MATRVAARLAAEGGGRSLELFHPAIRSPRQRRWETCADMAPISFLKEVKRQATGTSSS